MKSYTITVNGVAYEVTVEETAGGAASAATMPAMPKAPSATAPMPAAPAAPKAASAGAGANKIEAGAAGKVFKIEVKPGQAVKKGETVIVLEAMKMENNIDAERDGKIKEIRVNKEDTVMEGAILINIA